MNKTENKDLWRNYLFKVKLSNFLKEEITHWGLDWFMLVWGYLQNLTIICLHDNTHWYYVKVTPATL